MTGFNLPPGVTTSMIEDAQEPEHYLIRADDLEELAYLCKELTDVARHLNQIRERIKKEPWA